MRKIINQTTSRVFERGQWWDKTETDTIEVPDPTPTPAPVRTLSTNAPTCAHCHQAQTACRCLPPQPHAQAQLDADGWMPKSILNTRDPDTQPVTMSAETRAMRMADAEWDRAFYACLTHPNRLVTRDELTGCSTAQLRTLYGQLERGQSIKEVLTDFQKAWTPKSILGIRRP